MKKIFLTLFFVLFAFSLLAVEAKAEDSLYLHAGGYSSHFKERPGSKDYNERHKIIGAEYETSLENIEWLGKDYYYSAIALHMENSIDNDSTLLAGSLKRRWNIDYDENWKIAAGVVAGFQNGYPNKSKGRGRDEFIPVAYPLAEISYKRFTTYGSCVPEVFTSGFCIVGFKLKLHEFE